MLFRKVGQGILLILTGLMLSLSAAAADPVKPSIVEIIEIRGEINAGTPRELARYAETINYNQSVKAVVLVMDSPGGGVIASTSSYEELTKLKVPVVAWCDSVCASGAEYILMSPAVKFIGVREGTAAGSIGVIANVTRFNRLLDKLKIDNETYASGSLKYPSNPTRAASEVDKAYMQSLVSGLAERFYGVVGKARDIKDWPAVKTAKVFFGQEAVDIGLADAVMTREEAIQKAKELSGVKASIYTRDEMKKLSAAAEEHTVYRIGMPEPRARGDTLASLAETAREAMDLIQEVKGGYSERFEYRMPFKF